MATEHAITIASFSYDPADLTIEPGDTVVWTNNDFTAHTATARNGEFDSGDIAANGGTFSFTFNGNTGDIPYICTHHETMSGKITISS